MSSCETPGHSTYAMVPFSRAPLKLIKALFISALSWVWRSCRSFSLRCAWRARESSDWTRGTTPTHTPSLLGWSGSAQSPNRAGLSTGLPIVLAVQHAPLPPLPSPTLPSPTLPSLLLLLPLRPVEFLSLSLEGPLPPLGLPMNCPLHPLFGFSWLRWPRSSALQ